MKKVFVCIADGFEEVETITPIDYLRRCGIKTELVGLTSKNVRSSHGIDIVCDCILDDITGYAETTTLLILPGGLPNSRTLGKSIQLQAFAKAVHFAGGFIAAICAAPVFTLGAWGMLSGKNFTCYPGMGNELETKPLANARVVQDGTLITACSAGAAEEFAFKLIQLLCGNTRCTELQTVIAAR